MSRYICAEGIKKHELEKERHFYLKTFGNHKNLDL
jgi:hypothetical protein